MTTNGLEVRLRRGAERMRKAWRERLARMNNWMSHFSQRSFKSLMNPWNIMIDDLILGLGLIVGGEMVEISRRRG